LNPADIDAIGGDDADFIELEPPIKVFFLTSLFQPNKRSIMERIVSK